MISMRLLTARILAFFRKSTLDKDLEAEMASHLEMSIADHVRDGMTPDEARRAALVRFGHLDSAKDLHRTQRGLPFLDTILQDIRYAFRTLIRDAALSTFALLIIGIGVGASSTVFSVVNELLVRPLPFHDPSSLVWIANGGTRGLSAQTVQVGHLIDL